MSAASEPGGPGPRCRARMIYRVNTGPDLSVQAGAAKAGPPLIEERARRCHLEHGHPGPHRCTVPVPGRKGRLIEFRQGARA